MYGVYNMRGYESVMALCEFFNYMEYIMKDKELECLFVKHNVPNNMRGYESVIALCEF